MTGFFYFFNLASNPTNQPSIPGTIIHKTVKAFTRPAA
ncbi:hypothetical protein SynBIOSE41_00845 [Synechococcus sp. BIOS-E4-1]|nr:hypothetical protein SynBIOSE41_00845 [Synechococcus sp. BIOS-E4-1]